jgi:HK97 family phage portal protein
MSFWRRLFGRPAEEQRATLSEIDFWRKDGWMMSTAAGVSVTPSTAVTVPDVYACQQVLAQDVARCPLKLRARVGGEWQDADSHPLWEILHDLANPEMTAMEFRRQMQADLIAHEVAYAEIVRHANGAVKALWPLQPERMRVYRNGLNVKQYEYSVGERTITWSFDPDKPPILELRHPSPIHRCRDLIGLAMALDTYAAKFFANGARLSGILTVPGALKPDQRVAIRESFEAMHRGADKAHRVGVMEGGAKFDPLTVPNAEAQFTEQRRHVRTMIAGAFRVPPHKIGDLDRATFSNIEAQDRDYVNSSLNPYLVLWEQAVRRDLLTTRQYANYAAIFDREALIEADAKSRADALAVGRQNGWWSANDVRRKLHENPIPKEQGGDLYHQNGSMTLLTGNGESSGVNGAASVLADEHQQVM